MTTKPMLQLSVNGKQTYNLENGDDLTLLNGEAVQADFRQLPNGVISLILNGKSHTATVEKADFRNKLLTIRVDGQAYEIGIREPIDQLLNSMGMDLQASRKAEPVKAPMPGMILRILVTEGQEIVKGDGLLVLEAMKMENVLKATGNGTVKAIRVSENTAVEKGAVLIELA